MNVFEEMRSGEHYDIRDPKYQAEARSEMRRCGHICHKINATDPMETEKIIALEKGTFLMPLQIDCGSRVFLGKDVFANHDLTMMSLGTITIDDDVMLGPEVGLFTVNHEPKNIRTLMTKEIHIKKNAWIGARVSILPGVTIGENAIVGTGSVVTKDVPDNCVAVGVPAKVVKRLE